VKWERGDRGQDLVEFALIAPVLFLILFGIIEFGVAIWRYNTVAVAAREGARAALVFGIDDRETRATNAARGYVEGVGLLDADEVVVGFGEDPFNIVQDGITNTLPTVAVTVTYPYRGITGLVQLIPSEGIMMSASSSMLVE